MDSISDADSIATKITDILAQDYSAVQKRTQIYYGLGMKSGAGFHKLDKDAGNDALVFFHTILLQYFCSRTDTLAANKKIIECLKSLDLVFCAGKVSALELGSCPSSGEIFWHNMDDVCSNFLGKEIEFQKLEKCFQAQNSTTESTVLTCVSGMGGIGKTTLARKFAYHFRQVLNGSVAWIPAENASLVSNEFTRICRKLHITKDENLTTREFVNSVYEELVKKNDNVLFIFDNLDDPINKWIHEFLPSGLVTRRPFIIITSRRRDIIPQSSNVVDLDVLSLNDALQMIRKVCSSISSEIGNKLAETLQFYPLALQIALSGIGSMQSLNEDEATLKYIVDFDKNKAIILDQDETLPDGYKFTLSASLKITLKKLQSLENGDKIIKLLRVISIIYPDEIEVDLIFEILKLIDTKRSVLKKICDGIFKQTEPDTIGGDILEILCKQSILSVTSGDKKVCRMHRMIQYVIHKASNTKQMKNAVQIMLTWVESVGNLEYDNDRTHAKFLMKYLKENKSIHGLESYDNKMISILSTYAANNTLVPVEFLNSFMTKHFGEEPELYLEYIRTLSKKPNRFLKPKFQIILPLIDPLIVMVLLLRDEFTSKISRENLHLLQDMF